MLHDVLNKFWKQKPHNSSSTATNSHLTNHPNKMYMTNGELMKKQGQTHVTFCYRLLQMAFQCWLTSKDFFGFVWTRDVT